MEAGSPLSIAPKRAPIQAGVPLVAGARLPLAFIVEGLLALAAAGVWLVFIPDLPTLPHLAPSVLAIAHLLLPGFLLSVTYGAAYQLIPVVLGEQLGGEKPLWVHHVMHTAGLPLLVVGFAGYRFEWVALGGVFVTTGAGIFIWKTIDTFRRSKRRDGIAWSLPLSASWLGAVVVAGVVIAANRRWPFLSLSPLALLRAHAHLGLAGFFLTLLQGMSFQLVPMFTLGQVQNPRRITTGIICTQIGLLLLAPALAWGVTPLGALGVAVLLGGVLLSGVELRATFVSRRRKLLDTGLQAFALGAAVLLISAIIGVALFFAEPSAGLLRGSLAYGTLLVPGALSLMVLGMLCKIVPFLVWMRVYGSKVGKQAVPAANSLAHGSSERLWLILHTTALVLMSFGTGFASTATTRIGSAAFLAGLFFFFASMISVLKHLIRQPASAPSVSSK
jgi:hypothetical protein